MEHTKPRPIAAKQTEEERKAAKAKAKAVAAPSAPSAAVVKPAVASTVPAKPTEAVAPAAAAVKPTAAAANTLSKHTVTQSYNSQPLPQQEVYTPDNTPFQWKPGMSIKDVVSRGIVQEERYVNQEEVARKKAKMFAFTDFMKALGGLAGGGNANVQPYTPSPYMAQAFGEVDRLRGEKERSRMYYEQLEAQTKDQDYKTQQAIHSASQLQNNKYGHEMAKERNKNNMEAWKQFGTKVTQEHEDPMYKNAKMQNDRAMVGIAQQNANSQSIRAVAAVNPDKDKASKFLEYPDANGEISTMSKSNAQLVINQITSRFNEISEMVQQGKQLTPLEKEIFEDMANFQRVHNSQDAERSDNLIRSVALKYIAKDTKGELNRYFNTGPRAQSMQSAPQSATANQVANPLIDPFNTPHPQQGTGAQKLPNIYR